jgi:hypothetical protein
VDYIRAALSEEMMHADLLRTLIGSSNAENDPVQTFYFTTGTFNTLPSFIGILGSAGKCLQGRNPHAEALAT